MLEAARAMAVTDPAVRFEIRGQGDADLERQVEAAARQGSNLSASIGWQSFEEKTRAFTAAHLVVLPYTSFGSQSGVLHDAYGFGIPVLGTKVGALGASIREDGTGWVSAPGDTGALVEAIREAATAEERWRAAAAATARVREERGVRRIADRLLSIFAELAREAIGPS